MPKSTSRIKDPCRVIVPGRGLYMSQLLRLDYPKDESGKTTTEDYKTCGCRVLIPKKDRALEKRIRAAIKAACIKKFGKMIVREGRDGYPLLDGDEALNDDLEGKKGPEFKKHFYINCKSFNRLPGLVDADGDVVEDPEEKADLCVSGWYYKFSLTFKGSDKGTNRVRCEINNLMFVKEGERLDGGIAADAEDWGSMEDEDEDDFDGHDEDEDEDEDEVDTPRRRRSGSSTRASRRAARRASRR